MWQKPKSANGWLFSLWFCSFVRTNIWSSNRRSAILWSSRAMFSSSWNRDWDGQSKDWCNRETAIPPRVIRGMRSFNWSCKFYKRFIRNFAQISRPLINLLQKKCSFCFHQIVLKHLKFKRKLLYLHRDKMLKYIIFPRFTQVSYDRWRFINFVWCV